MQGSRTGLCLAAILASQVMTSAVARAEAAPKAPSPTPQDTDQAKLKSSVDQNTSDIADLKKTLGDTGALLDKYKADKADKPKAEKADPKDGPKLFNCGAVWPGASCGIIIGPLISGSKRGVTAAVVNNQVRVSADSSTSVAAFAEAHAFITNRPWPKWMKQGPFVAVGSATNNGFSAGLGWMVGVKPTGHENGAPITISLGYIWSPFVKVLGDGQHANQPLPPGETEVRYKTITTSGVLLAFGVSF